MAPMLQPSTTAVTGLPKLAAHTLSKNKEFVRDRLELVVFVFRYDKNHFLVSVL